MDIVDRKEDLETVQAADLALLPIPDPAPDITARKNPRRNLNLVLANAVLFNLLLMF